ncbi:oligopeptide/dipeptide ABC transporter ATP-binding protein [Thermotoga profunda]|uniref:oligopeptide/dipeptide ABC transporter ATP-binding protein n=1 Tax=Thermotoga profunda TaxID=1508420 RepID=UPI0005970104|nr:oligopeptide/dipeptide ABC transporter ATP-binding protein [Thermotoga profunda]
MRILQVNGLKKYFTVGLLRKYIIKALDNVSFDIDQSEIFGVLGESGCGKSTLGLVLSRIERETDGEILFKGKRVDGSTKLDPDTRREIQIIFQNPYESFDQRLTIEDSLMIPLRINKIGENDHQRKEIIRHFMHRAGLEPAQSFLVRYPHELSGGQLQRISLLRAMMLNPSFLIADECVSMLDLSVRASVINLMLDLVKTQKTTVMFITHDISLAKYVSDRIAVLYLGKIVELGTSSQVVERSLHPYTKVLVSYSPSIFEKKQKIKPKELIGIFQPEIGCNFANRCPYADIECEKQTPQLRQIEPGHYVSCLKV